MDYLPKEGGEYILDMVSTPIQYEEGLTYSKKFEKRWCADLLADALKMAEKRISRHGVFLYGSFFQLPFDENFSIAT